MVGQGRLLALLVPAVLALPGCAWLPFQEASCPEVTDTSAWINRMPGLEASDGKLHVVVRLTDDQSWKLSPVRTGPEGVLVLSLSEGGPSVPGTAAYQQKGKPLPVGIKIECHGKAVASIDEITVAW